MSEKIMNMNDEEVMEVAEEIKPNGILSKVGKFITRNGKKIAIGVAFAGGFVIAYGLGKNSVSSVSDAAIDMITDTVEDGIDTIADEVIQF